MCKYEGNFSVSKLSNDKKLKPNELLQFYRDYLIRARADASQDKLSLTIIINIKLTVFGLVLVLMQKGLGIFGVIFLPVIMFALDFYHRMRFEEILHRYEYIDEKIIPKIKELAGRNDFEFFEEQICSNFEDNVYQIREAKVRTMVTSISVLLSVLGFLIFINLISVFSEKTNDIVSEAWLLILFSIYFFLFLYDFNLKNFCYCKWKDLFIKNKFINTYRNHIMLASFGFSIIGILIFNHYSDDIMEFLDPILLDIESLPRAKY